MSEDTTTYNGWANYETWAVRLWMDNDEGTYNYWRERTREIHEATHPRHILSQREAAQIDIADELKREHEENAPEVSGVFGDLLSAALSEVDWHEIAGA